MTSAPLLFAKNLQWSQELCTLQGWWLNVEPSTDPSQSCPESHGQATPSPFRGLAFFFQDPQNGGKASVASSWGAQCGLQAPGVPLGRLVDLVPSAFGQLSLGECHVSLLSVVMGHPSYLRAIGKSAGVTCSCLRWGNIIAALTLLTRYWESVKHKWQGEQSKTEKKMESCWVASSLTCD